MKVNFRSVFYPAIVSAALGCASASQPPPATPSPAASEPATAKTESKVATESKSEKASSDAGATQGKDGEATDERDPRADGLRKASRPPAELITNPSVLYVFNFADSEVGQAATEQCNASAEGDRGKLSACLQKARSKVPVESVRFVKKNSGEYFWTTFNRYKGNLLKWHIVQFQVGEETADRVTLKLIGKDKGIAPMTNVPRTLKVELPNDYTVVLNDPEFGKMTFDAKIGALPEEK